MKKRYDRLRNQQSRIWRKRRRQMRERQKQTNIRRRNDERVKGGPDIDTSLKHVPMMQRILLSVKEALTPKKKDDQYQKKYMIPRCGTQASSAIDDADGHDDAQRMKGTNGPKGQ